MFQIHRLVLRRCWATEVLQNVHLNNALGNIAMQMCGSDQCNAKQCKFTQIKNNALKWRAKVLHRRDKSFAQQISPPGLCLGSVYTARSRHKSPPPPPPPPKTQNPPTTTVQVYTTNMVTQNKKCGQTSNTKRLYHVLATKELHRTQKRLLG